MRGFPLLRILVVAGALMMLGVPVWMLTRDRVEGIAAPVVEEREATGMADFSVVMTSTTPARLSVTAVNDAVRESDGGVRRFEARFEMPLAQPEDLAVFAAFEAEAGPQALRVEVRSAGRLVVDRTFWGEGEIHDVVEVVAP